MVGDLGRGQRGHVFVFFCAVRLIASILHVPPICPSFRLHFASPGTSTSYSSLKSSVASPSPSHRTPFVPSTASPSPSSSPPSLGPSSATEAPSRSTAPAPRAMLQAGYYGWLLYMAASVGDIGSMQELLDKDPLLVLDEGEYEVTGMFYAAARGGYTEVFRVLLDHAMSPRCSTNGRDGEGANGSGGGRTSVFWLEMMSRAVHAAVRGESVEMLRELVQGRSDVSAYLDVRGSTVLHAATRRGQLEARHLFIARCLHPL